MTWLAIRTFLGGIPRWAWIALAIVIAAIAFGIWLSGEKQKAVEADRSAGKAEAVSTARTADEAAHGAAQGKSEDIEHGNEQAREAARGSDDPLADALRSLRGREE
jgi:hypothetical protein